jgi:hypothetical protein
MSKVKVSNETVKVERTTEEVDLAILRTKAEAFDLLAQSQQVQLALQKNQEQLRFLEQEKRKLSAEQNQQK